jgi:hypothetical protein
MKIKPALSSILSKLDAAFVKLEATPDDSENFDKALASCGEMTDEQYRELLHRRSLTPFGKVWVRFRDCAWPLVDFYLTAGESEREAIREHVSKRPGLDPSLYQLADEQSYLIRPGIGQEFLKRIVCIFSIVDDGYAGGPGLLVFLSRICNFAEEAGLDYQSVLKDVAALSSDVIHPSDGDDPESTRSFLATFEPIEGW